MQANLKAVTAAGIQICREEGGQCDAVEVAYTACLLEEQQSWPALITAARSSSSSLTPAVGASEAGAAEAAVATETAAPAPQQQQQPQQRLTLCSISKLPAAALASMAERLRQELLQPADPAAAATARLQVALERSFKQQQDKVEAEQAEHASTAARLASAVAHKKVNMQAAGLALYQAVFGQVVDYVCTAAGLEARTATDPEARAQVSAAVESVLPLSSLAYFLTLPAQERMQQLESLAAISCGICLFNSHTGSAPSPVVLSADTQLLQSARLLADVQAAAAQAEAALEHHNQPGATRAPAQADVPPALVAAAAAYLGTGSAAGASSSGGGSGCGGVGGVQLGGALFCCQAAVALRGLAVDLSAGISCCRQLHDDLLGVLNQAAQVTAEVSGAAVLKEHVLPLFEAAGRLHLALKAELRLLLVRGRLWEGACDALATAAAQHPGVPKVLGFSTRRQPGGSFACSTSGTGCGAGSSYGGSIKAFPAGSMHAAAGVNAGASAAAVFDASSLPVDMQYVAPHAAAAAEGGEGLNIVGGGVAGLPAEQQVLALCGMCPVSIAGSVAAGAAACTPEGAGQDRLLLGRMAREECGFIRYCGKLYGFSTLAALSSFVSGPESVLDAVRQAAHAAPLLLHMLGLSASTGTAAGGGAGAGSAGASALGTSPVGGYGFGTGSASSGMPVAGYSGYRAASSSGAGGYRGSSAGASRSGGVARWRMPPLRGLLELFEAPLKVDAGTQTVTHVLKRLVDIDYEWNEWALRRRIIALANLRLKATHSAQTLHSCFRCEGSSQTWLPKEAGVQTRVNKGSSVPKKLRYVTGLRGLPDTKIKVVALELDVHGKGASVKHAAPLTKPGRL